MLNQLRIFYRISEVQNVEGKSLNTFAFYNASIHDVAITPDSKRMICVASGTYMSNFGGRAINTMEEIIFGSSAFTST